MIRKKDNGEESELVYIPKIREACGGIKAAIVLWAFIEAFGENDAEPFHRFLEPCAHPDYKEGESWCEILGFSRDEVRNAIKKLSRPALTKDLEVRPPLVWKKTKRDRSTIHGVYIPNVIAVFEKSFKEKREGSDV